MIVSVWVMDGSSGLCRVPVIQLETAPCDIWIKWSVSLILSFLMSTQKNRGFFLDTCGLFLPFFSYFLVEFPGAFRHCGN